jgi:hypothetical protein
MADIFDRKEEVLDVVLTRKGRELASANKLKPAYYEFYDSDIIYDADNSEEQNDSSERIKEGLYQKSTVSLFSKNTTPGQLITGENNTELPPMNLKNPIGSYEIGTQNAPAWSIQFYEGEYLPANDIFSTSEAEIITTDMNNVVISSSSLNGVNTNEERIPQFYVNVKYKLYQLQQKIKGGGTLTNLYFDKGNEDLLLSIEEANVFSSGESPEFEVEIYEVVDTEGNVEKNKSLKRLYFDKEDFEDLDSVENYLNVLFDEEARFESNFKEISIYNALQEEDGEECQ